MKEKEIFSQIVEKQIGESPIATKITLKNLFWGLLQAGGFCLLYFFASCNDKVEYKTPYFITIVGSECSQGDCHQCFYILEDSLSRPASFFKFFEADGCNFSTDVDNKNLNHLYKIKVVNGKIISVDYTGG